MEANPWSHQINWAGLTQPDLAHIMSSAWLLRPTCTAASLLCSKLLYEGLVSSRLLCTSIKAVMCQSPFFCCVFHQSYELKEETGFGSSMSTVWRKMIRPFQPKVPHQDHERTKFLSHCFSRDKLHLWDTPTHKHTHTQSCVFSKISCQPTKLIFNSSAASLSGTTSRLKTLSSTTPQEAE